MANLFIPLNNKSPNFEQVVTLDGVDFVLVFLWNDRSSSWYMETRDTDRNPLAAFRKIVCDIPFIVMDTTAGLPAGQLWFFTRDGSGTRPGLLDLGQNVQLAYIIEDNVL